MPFVLDLNRLIPGLYSAYPSAESSSARLLQDDVSASCEPGHIANIPPTSRFVTTTCSDHGRTIFRALVTDSGGVENRIRRKYFWQQYFSSSCHSSRGQFCNSLETTLLTFSNVEPDRNRIIDLWWTVRRGGAHTIRSVQRWPHFRKSIFCGTGDTKPSDCCDNNWISVTTGLNHSYLCITTSSRPSEQDLLSASEAFCKSWAVMPTSVLFNTFWTMLSFFLITFLLIEATTWG